MTVARKLTLALGALAGLTLVAQTGLQTFEEWNRYVEDSESDALMLARAVTPPLAAAAQGPDAARNVLELTKNIDRSMPETDVTWHWADEHPLLPGSPPANVWARLEHGESVSWTQQRGAAAQVVALIPVQVGARLGLVSFLQDSSLKRENVLRAIFGLLAFAAMLGVVFLLAAGVLGRRLIGNPAAELARMAKAVGESDLSARAKLTTTDELGQLARAFNAMAEQLQAAQRRVETETAARIAAINQLRHADRLVTVGRLGAGVAHELGTPLNVILGRARMIATDELDAAGVKKSALVITGQVEAMSSIVSQLLDFSRRKVSQHVDTDLQQLMSSAVGLLEPLAARAQVKLSIDALEKPLSVSCDPAGLHQVLNNLVVNAIHAMPGGGAVTLSARRTDSEVELHVRDTGPGLPAEVRQHLFEPFFTTKDVGQGTGLGLAVSWGIARDHGGSISAESPPGGGTLFVVHLPASPTP